MSGLLGITETAHRLGVTTRQVRNLVLAGDLHQVARGVIDATSVERYASVARTGKQAWAPPTAWAAIALLEHAPTPWLGTSQTARLRRRLRTLTPLALVERTRRRATATAFDAHRAALPRLAPHLISPRREAIGLAAAVGTADGYVAPDAVEHLVRTYALNPRPDGVVTLRATTMDLAVVRALAVGPVLAALDLAASPDLRERRAGLDTLQAHLRSDP
ncbi:hypothetical protein [Cellulomonas triticagri]|uniref:Uncharacterized protein n=1 Tax=Cellulomonas triticagri TaxID=2483352 RepID=A0A3M2JNH3_9CELL|nr:hypothetical protein [Cellulomonas triticagri]RMI13861.1 hypothetical protein EBM89_02500 [Cellulomonas triticagri]